MEAFHDYAYYYNIFYGEKDYAGEAATICDLISRYARKDHERKVLNIGCGTGRHDRELRRLGYHVYGIDLSREMIEIARKGADGAVGLFYEVQDARDFKVEAEFDVAVSLFHVMSYQNTNEELKSVLSCVGRVLNAGGIFIFDAWYGPGVLTDRPAVRVKRVEDDKNFFVRIAEPVLYPNKNVVDVRYNVNVIDKLTGINRTINEVHSMRYLFRPEIEEILSESGMELLGCLDCNTLREPDLDTWTAYFIAGKKR